jgi:hypothetical protein
VPPFSNPRLGFIKGAHHLKFGIDYDRSFANQVFRGNWRGLYVFFSPLNYVRALNKQTNPLTGQPYTADLFRVFFGEGTFRASLNEYAAYAQHSLKLSSKINLTLGLRYEAFLMPQPIVPNPLLPQTSRIPSDKAMWQPRLGLTWDLTGNAKTVLRLGGGLFYARTPLLLVNQAFNSNGNPNVGTTFDLVAPEIDAVQRVHPEFVFPFIPDTSQASNSSYFTAAGIAIQPDASFFAPDFRNPRSLQYTAGIERQVTENLAVALDYIHNNTVHLERIRDVNLAPPTLQLDNSTPAVLRPRFNLALRPNTNFGVLRQQESSARSNYDGRTLDFISQPTRVRPSLCWRNSREMRPKK